MGEEEARAKFAARIRAAQPKPPRRRGVEASPLRQALRDNYDEVLAARGRGVSWEQVAEMLAADGLRGPDNAEPTAPMVRGLFNAERYKRGAKPKRRRAPK